MCKIKVKSSRPNTKIYEKYLTRSYLLDLLCNPSYIRYTCYVLLILELILNILVIHYVKYTEIDWIAYIQEVEGFLNGTLDYKLLKGDTGPLVYPAGFLYIYSLLYYVTSRGENIRTAQYIFLGLYMLQSYLIFKIHIKTEKVPPYALILSTLTSYRIHSIYTLRLFNDPIATLLFYISLMLLISNKWLIGSIVYSLAVSVKMNILLYAPCLLLTYLTNLTLMKTFINLFVCGFVQIVLGAPFLYTNFISYMRGSFDLGRVFEHKWTVNYRFLDESIFESGYFHVSLLVLHISLLITFFPVIKKYLTSYAKLDCIKKELALSNNENTNKINFNKNAQLMVLPFFVTNLIGIACARSLHYQFYCWYFHSLLYLAYSTNYRKPTIFFILGIIELCWNTYPSTDLSSYSLHICHIVLLIGVYNYMKN